MDRVGIAPTPPSEGHEGVLLITPPVQKGALCCAPLHDRIFLGVNMNIEQNVHIRIETIKFPCLQTGLEPVSTVKTVALHYATENQEEGKGISPSS